jgi:hypothetical protein
MSDISQGGTSKSVRTDGGAAIEGNITIDRGSTFVGRDQIINHIQQIARTAAEEAVQARGLEAKYLAQGVSAFPQRLPDRAAETEDSRYPYKSLLEYRLGDAEIFFGRERDIRELLPRLLQASLMVVHSESGAGKTSLLHAGLSPQLIAAGHLPIYCRPYDASPALKIKQILLPDLAPVPQLAAAPLREFLLQVCRVVGPRTTLVILLDQFEEFFTRSDERSRAAFVNELADCLEDDSLNVRWVLALSSEYFSNLATFRPRIRNPFENDYRLNRLSRAAAATVIARPADRFGVSFEAGLIDRLLDDLGQDEIAPPQIQLVCSALYGERGEAALITQAMYERRGGAAGILRGHLEQVLSRGVLADQRMAAQRVLEALISSEPRRVLRSRAEVLAELQARGVSVKTTEAVLAQLIESRLVRAVGEGEVAYELVHDYLLDEIKLDPAVQTRKAAQELLDREVQSYMRYGTLVSDDKLAIISKSILQLTIGGVAVELLRLSRRRQVRRKQLVVGLAGAISIIAVLSLPILIRPIDTGWRTMSMPVLSAEAPTTRLAVNLNYPDIIFTSNSQAQNLWRSTDGGLSWTSIGGELPEAAPIQGVVATDQLLYVATTDGLWTSTAADLDWRSSRIVPTQTIEAVAVSPLNAHRVYAALHDASLFVTPDSGRTWEYLGRPAGLDGPPVGLATNGKTLLIASDHAVSRSDDEGKTWQSLSAAAMITDHILGLATVGQRGRFFIAAGRSGLYDAEVTSPIWRQQLDVAGPVYAVASTDNAFYLGREQDVICRRTWFWPESGWWRWSFGSTAPCQGSPIR